MSLGAPFSSLSSSPPSSPFTPYIDSSPDLRFQHLDSPPALDLQASPAHPFSASTHSRQYLPQYEKKSGSSVRHPDSDFIVRPTDGLKPFVDPNAYKDDAYVRDLEISSACTSTRSLNATCVDPEKDLWDSTIASAIDSVDCKIDLSEQGLTYIPPSISDLANLVVIPLANSSKPVSTRSFARSATTSFAPGSTAPPKGSFTTARTSSGLVFGAAKLGTRDEEIHLFLGNNRIRSLPNELFNLDALVVLSLRGNLITELPSQISQLKNLRELNVANNKLAYLPSEILDLRLTSLAVEPNPFIQPPSPVSEYGRPLSETRRTATCPTLTELALRTLFCPVPTQTSGKNGQSYLEAIYDLPLSTVEHDLPPAITNILSSCVPNCIANPLPDATPRASPSTYREVASSHFAAPAVPVNSPCISTCPSPRHLLVAQGEVYRRPVFVTHLEERYTWEADVAGVRITGASGNGRVPVRWRGCNLGCLDYLEPAGDGDDEDWDWDDDGIDEIDEMDLDDDLLSCED